MNPFTPARGIIYYFIRSKGDLVHEGMASLLAYRISKIKSASFSIAMNDYGFELLTDDEVPIPGDFGGRRFFSLSIIYWKIFSIA